MTECFKKISVFWVFLALLFAEPGFSADSKGLYYYKQKIKNNLTKFPTPMIGEIKVYKIRKTDTLLDIARSFSLGFAELKICNSGVDPWIPPEDEILVIPSEWILPECSFKGIVINIPEMRLYYFIPKTNSLYTFPIGLGMEDWQTPKGKFKVTGKKENPTWYVPKSIRSTMEEPKTVVPPGPDNPLGKYFLSLSRGYGIHGTNSPWSIGRLTTHGCIRLYPEDMEFFYRIANVGTTVEILYQPVKIGIKNNKLYIEVYDDIYGVVKNPVKETISLLRKLGYIDKVDIEKIKSALEEKSGLPVCISVVPTTTSEKK